MAKSKKYVAMPRVPEQAGERLALVVEVLAGRRSVSAAARLLGMSRNHFQTLLHRGLASLAQSIAPQAPGRHAKAKEVLELEEKLARLEHENAKLKDQAGDTERLLQVASGLLQGRMRPARQSRTKKTGAPDEEAGDPEPRLAEVDRMRAAGLTAHWAAWVHGVHESTVRRWRRREREGQLARRPRRQRPAAAVCEQVRALVMRLEGQVGAESIRHSIPGISRRQAARVKARTLCEMERARKSTLKQVKLAAPGLVRGMDAMDLRCAQGRIYALIAADAAVPYRTIVTAGPRYDARLVARTLEADIAAHGAPLVYRMDRAKAHDAKGVRDLLDRHQVLLLHGPPHCPRFYGQLERQNREHRAWRAAIATTPADRVEARLRDMLDAVNGSWRRRTLHWKTASEVWEARPAPCVDRLQLRKEVEERAARIARDPQLRGKPADLARRLAIEQALQSRGYLRQTIGGWC